MNTQNYPYKGYSLVSFINRYAIDKLLIGKRFSLNISLTCWIEICFPLLKIDKGSNAEHSWPFLASPFSYEELEMDLSEWGLVNCSLIDLKENNLPLIWMNAVGLFYHSSVPLTDNKECLAVENIANKIIKGFLSALQVINPDALRTNFNVSQETICNHFAVCPATETGSYQCNIHLSGEVDSRTGILRERDVTTALENCEKSLSVQYLLVNKANNDLRSNDYRGCVLNCSSAIEVTIRQKLEQYFEDNNTPEELVTYIFSQANGFMKYIELLKRLKLPTSNNDQIKIDVMDIRNRVIHGGFTPEFKAAEKCLSITREFLLNQKVAMFE